MPSKAAVYLWLTQHKEFVDMYTRAKEDSADTLADEILEISDDARNDWMQRNHGEDDPGWVANGEHIQRSRLRVDARKWIAAKLKPRKYGEFARTELTGEGGEAIRVAVIERRVIKALAGPT